MLFGCISGLREIIEESVFSFHQTPHVNSLTLPSRMEKNTPCLKFVKGVLAGKYQDLKVFTRLVEAMVLKLE